MLDGKNTNVVMNSTNVSNGSTPTFIADHMEDNDHGLFGYISQLVNASLAVDYFEDVHHITSLYPRNSMIILLLFSGSRIRLDRASISSGMGQLQRTSQKKRPLWMILARTLHTTTPPSGPMTMMWRATHRAHPIRLRLVYR